MSYSKTTCLAAILAMILALPLAGTSAQDEKAAPGQGKRAQEFIAAFNKGDAKAVAAFWTEEASYVDQTGHEVKGRAALEKMYAGEFAVQKGAKLKVTVTAARMVTADVALEDGITEVTPADGGPPTVARFSAVLVKKNGEWFFESVHDSVAHAPTNAAHFDSLELLIGEWVGEDLKGESATASYSWAENQNFIVSNFTTTLNGIPVTGVTQWIAWDSVEKQVRSWSFYSGGGIGEGTWTKDGNKWSIKVSAKTTDGKKVSATNVLTFVDGNHLTWQPTNLTIDGKAHPDRPVMKLKRAQAEMPAK